MSVRSILLQYGWSEMALLYNPNCIEQATCIQAGYPTDFQNSIANVNITVTYMHPLDGTEAQAKAAVLTQLANYSRSII
jgi:hypothetical protein